jgi:hypothetical protein
MKVEFITSFAVITPDPKASQQLYIDALGLPLRQLDGDYYASEDVNGCKYFGVCPWGQTVARLLSPEGAVIGLSYAPSLHGEPA